MPDRPAAERYEEAVAIWREGTWAIPIGAVLGSLPSGTFSRGHCHGPIVSGWSMAITGLGFTGNPGWPPRSWRSQASPAWSP
ncbi:hypothetical protein ACFV27_06875 [Streptomyces antimycoticus]|uniref:hypothetical protein n=1 Tax=Streptomyces antimycoticus TaxID=68175 RepID=UPI003690164A